MATLALSEEETDLWRQDYGFRDAVTDQLRNLASSLSRETRLMLADGTVPWLVTGPSTSVRIVRDEPRLQIVRETDGES